MKERHVTTLRLYDGDVQSMVLCGPMSEEEVQRWVGQFDWAEIEREGDDPIMTESRIDVSADSVLATEDMPTPPPSQLNGTSVSPQFYDGRPMKQHSFW